MQTDATLAEINHLILDEQGGLMALDAKFTFDDNALYRQLDIFAYRDLDEEDQLENEAFKYGLAYISLNGNIGCLVNEFPSIFRLPKVDCMLPVFPDAVC